MKQNRYLKLCGRSNCCQMCVTVNSSAVKFNESHREGSSATKAEDGDADL